MESLEEQLKAFKRCSMELIDLEITKAKSPRGNHQGGNFKSKWNNPVDRECTEHLSSRRMIGRTGPGSGN